MSHTEFNLEVVRRIDALEKMANRAQSINSQYIILTPGEIEDVTADQNNYALGNYDEIFLNPTANRIIYGITGGTKGRLLILFNSSSLFSLSFPHASVTATLGNRITTPTAGTIVLGTLKTAIFSYFQTGVPGATTGLWLMHHPQA